jgi:hypothetical protein
MICSGFSWETTMRSVVAVLAALALLVGASGHADAQGYAKKRHSQAKAHVRQPPASATQRSNTSDYVVRDANQLPVGSSIWWDQMLREGRGGTCCN